MDPGGWTLRELLQGYEFKNRQAWRHTALLCTVVEAYAGLGSRRQVHPRKYDMSSPMESSGPMRMSADRIDAAAAMFCGADAPEYVVDSQTGRQVRVK